MLGAMYSACMLISLSGGQSANDTTKSIGSVSQFFKWRTGLCRSLPWFNDLDLRKAACSAAPLFRRVNGVDGRRTRVGFAKARTIGAAFVGPVPVNESKLATSLEKVGHRLFCSVQRRRRPAVAANQPLPQS